MITSAQQGTHRARPAHPHVVSHARDLVRGSVGDVVARGSSAVSPQDDATLVDARHDGGLRATEPAEEEERMTSATEGEEGTTKQKQSSLVRDRSQKQKKRKKKH